MSFVQSPIRYVENNPVVAGMVDRAEDWRWSSAASHIAGKRVSGDLLTDVASLGRHVRNWRALLRVGLQAGDDPAAVEDIEARIRTGRPLASPEWIAEAEAALARKLAPQKRGPKPKLPKSKRKGVGP
jgi:putative transposase